MAHALEPHLHGLVQFANKDGLSEGRAVSTRLNEDGSFTVFYQGDLLRFRVTIEEVPQPNAH